FSIESEDGSASLSELQPSAQTRELQFAGTAAAPNAVDLMLMVDTTGSMGDELEFLKLELRNVLNRVRQDNEQLQLRASANFYRDIGDDYLVRPFAFTDDFDLIQNQLRAQSADGGGDGPEAVPDALENALTKHAWSESARARLLFLVLDAPPHYDQSELERVRAMISAAQRQGVRVIPVASSGIDKETEFLLRMLAIGTGGEYVFLTDDSGVGGGHIEPTIGEHQVEKLNDLLVRLVQKYSS
ncbi:MAG TPA: vWA domain-containing protein, partial [Candidatus Obscuribacterales bacterium]